MKRPGVAIGLVFTMFGVEQFLQHRSTIFIDRGNLVNLAVGAISAAAASIWLSRNMRRFKLDKVQIACLLLLLLSQASRSWTIAPEAFEAFYARGPLPYYVLYFLVAPILTLGKNSISDGIWTTIYIGIPLIFLMVFFVEWDGRGIAYAKPIMKGTRIRSFMPPLALASLASYIAIMCVVLKPKNVLLKVAFLTTFAMASYVVFRTQSRGQLVALGVVTLTFYPLANQASKFKELVITLAGFATIGLFLYTVFSFFDLGGVNRWNEASIERATEGRAYMITELLTTWIESGPFHLLFGLGSAAGWETSGFAVHNFPAEVLGELGLVGFSIYLFINIQTLINSFKILGKLSHYPDMRREAVILIALFAFSCLLSLKSVSMFSSAPLMLYFAIAISQLEKHSRQFSIEQMNLRRLFLISQAAHSTQKNATNFKPTYR